MGLFRSFAVSASGMDVQSKRMEIAAQNVANINSTQTPQGGPYRKRNVVVSSIPLSFSSSLNSAIKSDSVHAAGVVDIQASREPFKSVYQPEHPHANNKGFVQMPNVNMTMEMVDLLTASKAYSANVTVMNSAKSMLLQALDIGGL